MTPCAENMPVAGFVPLTVKKNVTFAVNYEVPVFERWGASSQVESVPKSTQFVDNPSFAPAKTKCEAPPAEENKIVNTISSPSMPRNSEMREISSSTTNCTPNPTTPSEKGTTRRSNRGQKKRDVQLERHRVRYDMELVPPACRNRLFLQNFPAWWAPPPVITPRIENDESLRPRRSSRLLTSTEEQIIVSTEVAKMEETKEITSSTDDLAGKTDLPSPFEDDSSVVWIPSKRSEWEDSIAEMTAVCTSASLRQHAAAKSQQPFVAPLSREYIRDRVDIDDPLNGYQIRHKTGGWLQGFILWTNFTTWTQYFKFDSLHPHSGVTLSASGRVDRDGFLSAELEAQPRSGDPYVGGVVFDSIAEIGLLGAIGCGEILLRMALDDIRIHHGDKYKYVVLQATDGSKSFYEKFGFIRVGAVCRYLNGDSESEVVGYRHWTNANESERSLQMHGGPSYLMALKLPDKVEVAQTGAVDGQEVVEPLSFLEEMKKYAVDVKPKIEQLGAAATPAPKASRRKTFGVSKKRGFDAMLTSPTAQSSNLFAASTSTSVAAGISGQGQELPDSVVDDRMPAPETEDSHRDKRQKPEGVPTDLIADNRGTSSMTGSSWAQQQYQSVLPSLGRRSPRDRSLSKPDLVETENLDLQRSATPDLISPPSQFGSNKTTELAKSTAKATANISSHFPKFSGPRALTSSTKNLLIKPQVVHEEKLDARFSSSRALQPLSKDAGKANFTQPHKKKGTSVVKKSASVANKPTQSSIAKDVSSRLDDGALYKQKMKSYPRDRVHFYNKVVRRKSSTGSPHQYFFVLHYEEQEGTIRIVPLQVSGILTGTRAGRPRWKAVLDDDNFPTVSTDDYVPVEAKMVMKTPLVAVEAWDVLGSD